MKKRFYRVLITALLIVSMVLTSVLPVFAVKIGEVKATYGDLLCDLKLPDGFSLSDEYSETETVGTVGTNWFNAIQTDGESVSETYLPVTVEPAYVSNVSISTDGELYYTGKPVEPAVAVSFNDEILKLNKDYIVTYENNTGSGTAKAVVEGIGNFKGKTSVTLYIAKTDVSGISISSNSLELAPGKIAELEAQVFPENATVKSVVWTSDNEEVASVDNNGKVKAHSNGTAVITASAVDGEFTAECIVNVVTRAEGVKINNGTVKMRMKDTYDLRATVYPEASSDKSIIWYSSDEKVATIDENGTVSSHKRGVTTITAMTADGEYIDTCEVEVYLTTWQWIIMILLFGWIWY